MSPRLSPGEFHAIVWCQSIRPLAVATGSMTAAADVLYRLSASCSRFWLVGKRSCQRPCSMSLIVGDRRTHTSRSKAHLICRQCFGSTIVRLKLRAHKRDSYRPRDVGSSYVTALAGSNRHFKSSSSGRVIRNLGPHRRGLKVLLCGYTPKCAGLFELAVVTVH